MASLRSGRPSCIRAAFIGTSNRAGFRRRQRSLLHRLKADPRKNHVDFVEGIWREFLDPHVGSEDTPAPLVCSFKNGSPGDLTHCWHTLKPKSPAVHLGDPLSLETPGHLSRAADEAPTTLGADDVDMQLAEASSPRAVSPGGSGMMEEDLGPLLSTLESPRTGRRAPGRARVSWLPPRLGSDRDKGPKLSLSKRKLELFLSEPERRKRKRQHAA